MVICLERGADLHMAQLMPLPLTVSCFSEIQTGCTFLVPAYPGSPGQRAIKRAYVCVCNNSEAISESMQNPYHFAFEILMKSVGLKAEAKLNYSQI